MAPTSIPKSNRPQHFLKYWREKLGFTQEQLATAANTGQQQVSKLEKGLLGMDLLWADRFGRAMGITAREVMFGPDDPMLEAMRTKLAAMSPEDAQRLLKIADTFLAHGTEEPATPLIPPALRRAAEETGEQLNSYDPQLWRELDNFAKGELQKIPEIGDTTEERRAEMVATIYLIARRDVEAGLKPDYGRLRLFIVAQAKTLRARKARRPQA